MGVSAQALQGRHCRFPDVDDGVGGTRQHEGRRGGNGGGGR